MPLKIKPAPCSQAELREILSYDGGTGELRWNRNRPNAPSGKVAGTINRQGHVVIMFLGRFHYAHRLAWLYMTGEWPAAEIDHKNRLRADNRWDNLREATRSQNQANKPSRNKLRLKGVYQRGSRFEAQIRVDGKTRHLGSFGTPQEAHSAYLVAATAAFGDFARGT